MKISLKNSGVLNSGAAIPPTSAHMEFGELAINYSSTDPSIFIKDSAGAIRRLVGVGNISFNGYQAIVPVVSTSPANVAQGNLYWDTGNERLYIYNGSAWKTATTLPFNEATIPDVTNASDQSGTFDDRYLRKSGGSITGSLSTSNPITSAASYIRLNNSTLDYQGASDGSGGYFKTSLDNVNATANRTILLPNISGTLITTADSGTVTASMIGSGEITNTQISNSANISASKIATGVLPSGLQVNSANIVDGSIVDADVNASAAITLTKLGTGTLPSGIQVVDANLNAGISASKVNTGTLGSNVVITASNYQAGSIGNVAINASAEIDVSKLADGGARQLLQTDSTGNNVEWTSNVDIPGTLDVTGNAVFDNPVTINDVLTVNSTEIVLNSPIISITDKNITLNNVSSPSDANAAGGGLTVKGTTDKTYSYDGTHDAFTSSENINLGTTSEAYKIAGANVLTATALGSGVVGSSLTSVGTISSGTWQGSAITDAYLNTITTSGKVANSATTATTSNTPNAIVSRDGSGDITVRNVNGALVGNASTATALQTARTIALTGHITGSASFDGTSNISINSTINTTVTDTNLTWTASTRTLASSTGTDAVITLFDASNAGLTPASGGGTGTFLRSDGSWVAVPATATNLSYTAGTSTLNSSTGTGVSLPDFTDYNSGLTPASGGGTTKFLRADGTWVTIGSGTQGSDLAYVTATRTVTNTNGTGFVLPLSTTSAAGLLSSSDKTKLDGLSAYTDSDAISAVTGSDLDMGGNKVLFANVYSQLSDLPSASTYHGMFAHVHATGKGYFAHAGNWIALATLTNGKLTSSEIPDIAITEYLGVVANQTAMLALTGEKGDWCVRSDDGKVYVITGTDTTQASSWTALSYPAVSSTPWTTSGNDINYTAGSVAIGTSSVSEKLTVAGDGSFSGGIRATGNNSGSWSSGSGLEILNSRINAYNRSTNAYIAASVNTLNWNIDSTGSALFTGLDLHDNDKIRLGTGDDLEIYHDGSHSYISDTGTGYLIVKGSEIQLQSNTGEDFAKFQANGSVELYYDNAKKLETASTGILLGLTTAIGTDGLQNGGSGNAGNAAFYRFDANDSGPFLQLAKSRNGTVGGNTVVQSGDELGTINFQGADGTDYHSAARIAAFVDGTPGNNDMPGRLVFSTTADGASSPTEKVRITSDGKIGVGTVSPANQFEVVSSGATKANFTHASSNKTSLYLESDDSSARVGSTYYGSGGSFKPLAFLTSGQERLRINSDGKIGVGTTSPPHELSVHGATATTGTIEANRFSVRDNYGNPPGLGNGFYSPGANVLAFATNSTERMRLDSSGRLGVGLSAPNNALHVYKTGDGQTPVRFQTSNATGNLRFYNDSVGWSIDSEGDLRFVTNRSGSGTPARMVITSAGKIGVGTNSPSEQLTVAGHIDIPNVNSFIKGGGHNVIQVDSGKTYFYGGASGVELRKADNSAYLITVDNNGAVSLYNNLDMQDSDKIMLGTGDDLELFHDGANSYVYNNTGTLFIDQNANDNDLNIRCDNGSGGTTTYVQCDGSSGAVKLHHYGSQKFETNANGIIVTGSSTATYYEFGGVGGNSGNAAHSYAIYQEAGGWGGSYPDLRIAFHTGINIGANASYGGVRFMNDAASTNNTQVMSVNRGADALGAGNVYVNSNLQANSSLRAPIFYDSNNTTYYANPSDQSVQVRLHLKDYAGSSSTGGTSNLQIQNNGGTGDSNVACLAFHCSGYYGMHMHLRHDGTFGIGGWSASTYRWYVDMSNGNMTAAGNVTAYSDIRLKEEINPLNGCLDKLLGLNGVSFRWKDLPDIVGEPGKEDIGIIAQEIEKVFPEVVHESAHESPDGDKYKTVAYDKLVPVLIEAVKELSARITALESK